MNEEKVISQTVRQIIDVVDDRFANYEVLFINDGSSDATGPLIEALAQEHDKIRVLHNERNLGLGASYRRGIGEARHQYVMLLCGDGGMPATSLPAIFEQIGKADIVIPFVSNLRQIKSRGRFLLSRAYTGLLNTLLGLRLRSFNGLPVHRVDLVRSVDIKSDGFGFQGEILVKLLKGGCSYVEVGVDGAEKTRRSSAMRPKSWINVAKTLILFIWEVARFDARAFQQAHAASAGLGQSKAKVDPTADG